MILGNSEKFISIESGPPFMPIVVVLIKNDASVKPFSISLKA